MKIVILDAATLTINNDIDFSIFDRFGEVKIYDFTKDEEIPERIKDADVILCKVCLLQDITTLIWNIQEKKGLQFVMPEAIQQRQWLSMFLHLYFIITTQSQGMMNL